MPQSDDVSNACDTATKFEKQTSFGECDKYKMRDEKQLIGMNKMKPKPTQQNPSYAKPNQLNNTVTHFIYCCCCCGFFRILTRN